MRPRSNTCAYPAESVSQHHDSILEARCAGLGSATVTVLERLEPSGVHGVVSGPTHQARVGDCDCASVKPQRPFLLASAGQYGTLLADIALRFQTGTRRPVHKSARNVVAHGTGGSASTGNTRGASALPGAQPHPAFAADVQVRAFIAP